MPLPLLCSLYAIVPFTNGGIESAGMPGHHVKLYGHCDLAVGTAWKDPSCVHRANRLEKAA